MPLWSNTDEASSAPKYTVNITNGATGVQAYGQTPVGTYAIDAEEAVTNNALAGWNLRTEGTGGRAGRVSYECLVAMGSITGDGDTLPPTPVITIVTQPSAQSVTSPADATFTVVATNTGTSTLSYQWQVDSGTGFSNISGATSDTLVVESTDTEYVTGNEFRVIVSGTNGADSVTSANVGLTIV